METFDLAKSLFFEGLAHLEKKDYEEAAIKFHGSLELVPDRLSTLTSLSATLIKLEKYESAKDLSLRAISLDANASEAWLNLGLIEKHYRDYTKSINCFDKAIQLKPEYAEAWCDKGTILSDLKRHDEALACYDQSLRIKPDLAEAWANKGVALHALERHDEALVCYDQSLGIKPDFAEAWVNKGVTLRDLKRLDEALVCYDQSLRIKPDFAEAWSNKGVTLHDLKRHDEALICYDQSLRIKPDFAEAWTNKGVTLHDLKRHDEALVCYDQSLRVKPDYAEAWTSKGVALNDLGRNDEALSCHDKSLHIKPDLAEAWSNKGVTLGDLKRYTEALASYEKAISLKPDIDFLYGALVHTKMLFCDWSDFDRQIAELANRVDRGEKATSLFPFLALTGSEPLHRKAAEIWVEAKCKSTLAFPSIPKINKREKICIGYYSADFHDHATAYLMAGLIELHDRNRFQLFAFSFGPDAGDEMRQRLVLAFDQFIDVRDKSDKEVAELSRELRVDIAVDLKGFTQYARTGIFAQRAAPLQVNYLGYPGTMGAQYIDYIIVDRTLIPESSRRHYSEKIAYLPNSYQINDGKRKIADTVFTRSELGLPETGFVFCCFNNNFKITPNRFDGWSRILKQVEGSVLWLLEDNPTAVRNLRKEAVKRGVSGDRLIFAKRMALPEHLARHRAADLFLDTLPYNAHTTASDALWAGLPVLTCIGETFAGRVAASLLNAIHLPELITRTQGEYEALAIDLATNSEKLGHIKKKLSTNRLTTPLFDTPLFTKHIEAAYTQMVERYRTDLPPEHIYVKQ